MAPVINPAIRVALILLAVAAGIAGMQAMFSRFDGAIPATDRIDNPRKPAAGRHQSSRAGAHR
jgi:hypothetical protein